MIVNQHIDLLQEQVDTLWQLAQLGCKWKMQGLCITSVQYANFTKTANLSKYLSSFLLQNWSLEFEEGVEAGSGPFLCIRIIVLADFFNEPS